MPVTAYSTTAASNNGSPPNGAPEGMAPSSVNDVIRQIMADIALEAQTNNVKVLKSVSGTNTITADMDPELGAYVAGMVVIFTPANTNTGATTIAIDGLAALDIQKGNGAALVAGDLVAGIPALLLLDSGADDFILINAAIRSVANGGTGIATLTGVAYGNGTGAFSAATAAQIVSAIGATAVTNATNAGLATNAGFATTQAPADSSTAIATTAHVKTMSAGWSQTWQDVTASRSTFTDYTNSSGKPITLSIYMSGSGSFNFIVVIDALTVGRASSSSGEERTVSGIIVPNGSVFRVEEAGAVTTIEWLELR